MTVEERRIRRSRVLWRPLLVVLVLMLVTPTGARAQAPPENDVLERIERAFVQGDSRALLQDSADRIEIALFETSTLFSRAQALYVLETFFRRYPPDRCTLRQSNKSNESWFAGGQYWYRSGESPLRLYVGLRRKGTQWEVREIRIDERRAD